MEPLQRDSPLLLLLLLLLLQAALDAFAAETLERLRDAGGAELEALILNASSPQIVELSARIGYPADVRSGPPLNWWFSPAIESPMGPLVGFGRPHGDGALVGLKGPTRPPAISSGVC